jgi:hypothetical protein
VRFYTSALGGGTHVLNRGAGPDDAVDGEVEAQEEAELTRQRDVRAEPRLNRAQAHHVADGEVEFHSIFTT